MTEDSQKITRAVVILDLDGVLLRDVRFHQPNHYDQARFFLALQRFQNDGLHITVLTNRPPGAMVTLAYSLGINHGYWVTESGGSYYEVRQNKAYVASEWYSIIPRVEQLREYLENAGVSKYPTSSDAAQFQPGMGLIKTTILPPPDLSPEEYAIERIQPLLMEGAFSDVFVVTYGKTVDIDPVGISKSKGMRLVLKLNGTQPNSVPTLWIGDHSRDIAAARMISDMGGVPAAVGNADMEYKAVVEELGGITAPETTSYHSSVVEILNEFWSVKGLGNPVETRMDK